jgi:hypothetical protein
MPQSRVYVMIEVRDVAPGLWLWRQPHPAWSEEAGWEPEVSSFFVEAGGERVVLDPLAPPPGLLGRVAWERLETSPPTVAVILKPDHVRDVDLFARWYGVRAYGPFLFWSGDAPKTELEGVQPGDELPGGLLALHDGRERGETPIFVAERRALVFADGMTAPRGVLRIWGTPWHEERVLPAFRRMLELPFEHVLVSHGEPVHTRADFEAALEREPWRG